MLAVSESIAEVSHGTRRVGNSRVCPSSFTLPSCYIQYLRLRHSNHMFFVKSFITFRVAHGGATVTCDKFVFNTLQHSDYFLTSVVKIRVKEGVSGS